jgi:hypothetical protein
MYTIVNKPPARLFDTDCPKAKPTTKYYVFLKIPAFYYSDAINLHGYNQS